MRATSANPCMTLAVVICLSWLPGSTQAMMPHIPFDQVIAQADIGFVGTVVDMTAQIHENTRMVTTDVTFSIDQLLFGENSATSEFGPTIVLTFAGGDTPGGSMIVSDVPRLELSKSYVVLAHFDGQKYFSPVIGGFQGLFPVETDQETGVSYPVTYNRNKVNGIDNSGELTLSPQGAPAIILGGGGAVLDPALAHIETAVTPPRPVPGSGASKAELSADKNSDLIRRGISSPVTLDAFLSHIRARAQKGAGK